MLLLWVRANNYATLITYIRITYKHTHIHTYLYVSVCCLWSYVAAVSVVWLVCLCLYIRLVIELNSWPPGWLPRELVSWWADGLMGWLVDSMTVRAVELSDC